MMPREEARWSGREAHHWAGQERRCEEDRGLGGIAPIQDRSELWVAQSSGDVDQARAEIAGHVVRVEESRFKGLPWLEDLVMN